MLDGTEKMNLVKNVAPMRNVMLLGSLIRAVIGREEGMPGMACFHGFSGYGKSQAALYNTQATNACWVEIKSIWTRKDITEKICLGLGIPAGRTVSSSVEKIGKELALSGRPLLLDEGQILCTDAKMLLLHDLYESAHGGSIILIGEEDLPQRLREYDRIHNRMLDWVAAEPADRREVGVLAALKFPDLSLSPEVLQHTLEVSQAVARRIVSNLAKIKDYARDEGKSDIEAADIPHIRWMSGDAPSPRRVFG